jgi:hypothetical protein
MSVSDIVIHYADNLYLFHYYAAQPRLQSLYPNFLRHAAIEQIQMCLSYHFQEQDGNMSDSFITLMTHMGGCFPLPESARLAFPPIVIVAPPYNYTRALKTATDPLPPAVLFLIPPNIADAISYSNWRNSQQAVTKAQRNVFIMGCELTFGDSWEHPSGLPGPFSFCNLIHLKERGPHKTATPDHPIHPDMEAVRTWLSSDHVQDSINAPKELTTAACTAGSAPPRPRPEEWGCHSSSQIYTPAAGRTPA